MKNKRRSIIAVIAVIAIMLGIVAGIYVVNKSKEKEQSKIAQSDITNQDKEKSIDTLTDVEKEIAGISSESQKDEEKNYSEMYKEYLELPEEEKKDLEVIPRKEEVPFEKIEDIKENLDKGDKTNNEIPTQFNLADKIDIKVENQGGYGLCWDFASIKSLETYLALNNLGNYDFSELHVDYITSNLMYGSRELHEGGNFGMFKEYLAESGVVLEEKVPYDFKEYSEEEYEKFPDMEKVIEVTETVDFPSIYKNIEEKYTEEQLKEYRDAVKKHIMKNGGLYTSIVGTGLENAYVSPDNDELWTNHAVTIVGWDDNYSKENFSDNGHTPEHDGAYIALNSWGEFSNNNGYYYISYDDKYVELNLSGIVSTSIESAYKINSIQNTAIKNYLKENYSHLFIKYNGEDYITKNVISNIMTIDLSNRNMYSLNGIEIFNNIYSIDISNNNIKDLTPLTKIKTLSNIYASNNQIKDVSVLKNMEKQQDYMTLNLNISNNPYVTGMGELSNLGMLDISNCKIKDVSSLQNCQNLMSLIVEDTPGITGLDKLPESLNILNLTNCNLTQVPQSEGILQNISALIIANNNITTLNGVENFKNIYELDVSGNPITDWSSLSQVQFENSDEMYMTFTIKAENCGIEDVSIFGEINTTISLELANNNIKDVSSLKDKEIYWIDLSGNKNVTGLQVLTTTDTIMLNNCDIKDVSENVGLENLYNLSLENNDFTDLNELSKIKNLTSLSLAGNKNLTGILTSETLGVLNLTDCNLDKNFDFSKLPALNIINVSKNTNLTELISSATSLKREFLSIVAEGVSYEQFAKLKTENPNVNFSNATITINTSSVKENEVDISQYKELRNMLRKYFANTSYRVTNGILMKNCNKIDVTSSSKEPVEIKFKDYGTELNNSTVKIIYNTNEQNNDEPLTTPAPTNSIPENSTSTNVTTENSVVTNDTTNQTPNI